MLLHPALSLLVAISASQAPQPERIRDVVYLKQGGAAFTYDVFKPAKPSGKGLILIVSGGWVSDHNGMSLQSAKMANDRGFTVFQVVHGTQPRYRMDDIVPQITRAVRHIHANATTYGVNPSKLGISGASAGGHLSLMIAASAKPGNPNSVDEVEKQPATVAAAGVFFPPTDFSNWGAPNTFAFDNRTLVAGFGRAWVPDPVLAKREEFVSLAKRYSPIEFVTKGMPPTMIIHGDADSLVPLQQSQIFIKKLEELGIKNKLQVMAGKNHGWPGIEDQFGDLLTWFEQQIP